MSNLYAYDAGFVDGKQWQGESETARGWHQMTIHAISAAAFGVRCGVKDGEVVARGTAWDAACSEYDRGFVDGLEYRA